MFYAAVLLALAVIVVLNVILITRLRSADGLESRLREDNRALREELASSVQRFVNQNDQRAEFLRTAVGTQLESIRGAVDHRLEQMRQTVDEKLQTTLETRLGESFRLVSERLEQVHKGLGEMQNLASGVGDLKRVLSNVTTRGAWGEVQLGNLLEQMLAPDQYERDVATTGTA